MSLIAYLLFIEHMALKLEDLQPREATFSLSEHPDKPFVLKKLSLATQVWLRDRFGADKIKGIFENQSLPEISEIAFHLLKDKTVTPTLESLQEAVVTQADRIALIKALLQTVGISQPVLDKLNEEDSRPNA